MKKLLFILAFTLSCYINVFPQATSLTIDCQTPGNLSNMINYEDQITMRNIKITGYINYRDLGFLKGLNKNNSLSGVIDLEDVVTVSGGTIKKDSTLPDQFMSGWKHIQKFVYPKSLIAEPYLSPKESEKVDSIIWTSDKDKSLYLNFLAYDINNCDYIFLAEGVEEITDMPNNIKITFPNSLKKITEVGDNLTIYSFIKDPESVYAERDFGYGTLNGYYHNYCATITNSTFYIPKGTREKYLNSDFATMKPYTGNGTVGSNGNVFIEYYDIESIVVTPSLSMYIGDSAPLSVNIYPDDNLVSWIDYISSSPEVANANSDGVIVANKYGQTEIHVTPHVFIDGLETKTGKCIVNVFAHTEGVDVPSTMTIHIDEKKELNAKTLPLGMSDNKIIYESSNPTIADIIGDGVVVGHKLGKCTITATSVDGGHTATCEVTVTQPVEALTLEKHSVSLKVGDTEKLFVQITPTTADDKTIVWSSSDGQIASVDASGNVNALKAGEVWVKAVSKDNAEAKDSCKVTVKQPATGIGIDNTSYQLNQIGASFILNATVSPEDATNKNVKWKSSNESVCIVSNGQVVAVGEGVCVIIATAEDGGFMATCTVTVSDATAISSVEATDGDNIQVFDINGTKVSGLKQGINIIRFADGTKKKVFVK